MKAERKDHSRKKVKIRPALLATVMLLSQFEGIAYAVADSPGGEAVYDIAADTGSLSPPPSEGVIDSELQPNDTGGPDGASESTPEDTGGESNPDKPEGDGELLEPDIPEGKPLPEEPPSQEENAGSDSKPDSDGDADLDSGSTPEDNSAPGSSDDSELDGDDIPPQTPDEGATPEGSAEEETGTSSDNGPGTDGSNPDEGQCQVQIGGNEWIEIEKGNSLEVIDGNNIIATWEVKEGGIFAAVKIEGSAGEVIVTETGAFVFDEEDCSLEQDGARFTLRINGARSDITISVYGEAENPPAPVRVHASGNEWIEIDPDTGLTFENGVVTATWSIKTDGKLAAVSITNEDGSIVVTEPGEFIYLEQPCILEQTGDIYTLRLTGIEKDTELEILGESALPETVTVKLNTREELLVVDKFQEQQQGPGGSNFILSFQFVEGVIPNSFTVKVGEESNTVSLTPGDFVVGGQTYRLELTQGPTGRPVYDIHLNHLIADAEITPNISQTVSVAVNDPSRVLLQTGGTIVTNDSGSATVKWALADKNKLNSILLSVGDETKTLTANNRNFTINGISGTLSVSGSQYTLNFQQVMLPVTVNITATDDIIFGGFELSKNKTLLPFKSEVGSSTDSNFGLTVSYETRSDGSVLITHNADRARFHSRNAKLISQSHENGQIIRKLTSPITVSVTVQCTAGCKKYGTATVTIPYRKIDIEFQDELGNVLPAPAGFTTSCYSMDNRTYEFAPPAITWYEYMTNNAKLSKTATSTALREESGKVYFALDSSERGKIILKYRARGRVNFDYKDELGNPIYFENAKTSVDGYRGNTSSVSVPTHEWYDYVSASLSTQGSTPSGSITSSNSSSIRVKLALGGASTVTVKYRAKALVNVKYVDELGNPIDDLLPVGKLTQVSGYRGNAKTIPTPDVPDYQYQTMYIQTESGQVPSGSIQTGSKTLTLGFEDASTLYVVYQPKASVNVRYVDDRGNPIDITGVSGAQTLISGLRGETYAVNTPAMKDYTYEQMYLTTPEGAVFSGVLDANAQRVALNREYASTITVVYRAKASFAVDYVDDLGNNINHLMPQGTPFGYSGHRDDTFTIPLPEISDYEYRSMGILHPETASGPNESAELDSDSHKATMKAGYNSVVQVKYWAKGDVAIRYEDELGNEVPFEGATLTTGGYRGDINTIELPKHPYYDWDTVTLTSTSNIPSGAVTEQNKDHMKVEVLIGDDSTITVRYKAKADVAVKYVDELGNSIDSLMPEGTPFMISGYRGEAFPVQIPDMADYVYESMSISTPEGETVSGILDAEAKSLTMGFENASTVTVVYHAKASVQIRYVDDLGAPIDGLMPADKDTLLSGLRGDSLTVKTPEHADYTFEQMYLTTPEGQIHSGMLDAETHELVLNKEYASTVTLVYRARASFEVHYIDDLDNDIDALVAGDVPFVYAGHRGDIIPIPVPELEDYQYNSMFAVHPDTQSGGNESVSLDTEAQTATMLAGYNSTIYVRYDYRATVYLKYVDMDGNDISSVFDPAIPGYLEGFRNRTTEIPHPDQGPYIFDHFEIETLAGEDPSGYLHGGAFDPTLTFGVREGSTVTAAYRWIDLGIELKEVLYENEPIGDNMLHLAEHANFVWTITNHGTAPAYPEIQFATSEEFIIVNKTGNSTMTDGKMKLDTLLQPGESIEVVTQIQVDTVKTHLIGTVTAVIPAQQEDKSHKFYPDIDLANNEAAGKLEVLNPPIIMKKADSENSDKYLEKCYIEIFDKRNELVWEGWSDESGEWYVTGLYPGEYRIWERYAPEGYARSGRWLPLTVKSDMTAKGTTITNDPVKITIQKVDGEIGKPLAGAQFGLYDETGRLIETAVTDDEGFCSFLQLDWGEYTVEELEAPEGYIASGKIIRFKVDDRYQNGQPYEVRNYPIVHTGAGVTYLWHSPVLGSVGTGAVVLVIVLAKRKRDEE